MNGISFFFGLSYLPFFNSREAIAEAIIGLLLFFFYLFRRHDFCYDHMTSQPLQICFCSFVHAISTELRA